MLGTLTRAGEILELFTPEHPEWGVTEAAARLGIPKSKAHNTLTSLVEIGLLQRGAHGRYRLGWRTVSLASTALRTAALTAFAGPVMRDLAAAAQGTVHLLAQEHGRVVCLDRRNPPGATRPLPPSVGTVVPFDAGPGGLVLLAHSDRQTVRALWHAGRIRTGHDTLDDLHHDLREIRARGWSGEESNGRAGSAAPVRDAHGTVTTALVLTLAGIRSRAAGRPPVVAAAEVLSARLQDPPVAVPDARGSGRFTLRASPAPAASGAS